MNFNKIFKFYFSDDIEGVEMATAVEEKDQRLYNAANYSNLGTFVNF